nr:LysR substrate-binding domain-containing protein [Stutzerimonas azotifigens]
MRSWALCRPSRSQAHRPEVGPPTTASGAHPILWEARPRGDCGERPRGDGNRDLSATKAARIGPDVRMAVVGTPAYFASRPAPLRPQHLLEHNCINLRLPTLGDLYAWEFDCDDEQIRVRVDGQLILNGSRAILQAGLDGFGLGYLPTTPPACGCATIR